jgi:signal transduction histidine kinase
VLGLIKELQDQLSANNLTRDILLLLLLISFAIVILRPGDRLVHRFVAMQVAGVLAIAAEMPPSFLPAMRLSPITSSIYIVALGLQTAAFIAFCAGFETHQLALAAFAPLRIKRIVLGAAYLALCATSVAFAARLLAPELMEWVAPAFVIIQLIGMAVGLGLLALPVLRGINSRIRYATAVVWCGAVFAYLPALLAYHAPALLGRAILLPLPEAALLLGLLPLALGFASIRWRTGSLLALFDRVSVYLLLALILLLIYAGMELLAERFFVTQGDLISHALTLLFAVIAAVTFAPLRSRLQRITDTLLFRDYYDFGLTLQRFSEELAALRNQEGVIDLLLDGLRDTLNLSGIAFVALPEGLDPQMLRLIEKGDLRARGVYATPDGQDALLHGLATLDLTHKPLTRKEPLLLHPWPDCAALLFISSDGGDTGGLALLAIGAKRTGSSLRAEDRALLITVAHQAAAALANAMLLAGVQTSLAQLQLSTAQLVAARSEQQLLLRKLVDADERQRAALAEDLHDDALQEVLYLIRHSRLCADMAAQLEELEERVQAQHYLLHTVQPTTAENTTAAAQRTPTLERLRLELTQLAERSVVVEQRLRALYLGLYPVLLNTLGLIAALEDLAGELSSATGFAIQLTYSDEVADIATALPPEAALHLYRITQEALRNISRHAQADWAAVQLHLTQQNTIRQDRHSRDVKVDSAGGPGKLGGQGQQKQRQLLRLIIEDNGVGLPLPLDFISLLREGHLGLAGMRERAERIGGELAFAPRPERGTRITLDVPLTMSDAT